MFLALHLSEENQQRTSISGCDWPKQSLRRHCQGARIPQSHIWAQESWGRIFDLQSKLVCGQEPSAFLEVMICFPLILSVPQMPLQCTFISQPLRKLYPLFSSFSPHSLKSQHFHCCSLLFMVAFNFSAFLSPHQQPYLFLTLTTQKESRSD